MFFTFKLIGNARMFSKNCKLLEKEVNGVQPSRGFWLKLDTWSQVN